MLRMVLTVEPPALVSSKLLPNILSTSSLRDLSVVADRDIMNNILTLFEGCFKLSSAGTLQSLSITSNPDSQSIQDVLLHEVLIPTEPSLVQISRNHRFLSKKKELLNIFRLLCDIFYASAFHQPTLDFICSSDIPMVYLSLLSKVEDVDTNQFIIWLISDNINEWKEDGPESAGRGRILIQTLEQEGFRDGLDQTLLHDKLTRNGSGGLRSSLKILNHLGLNSPEPE